MKDLFERGLVAVLALGFLCLMGAGAFAKDPNPERPFYGWNEGELIQMDGLCDPGVPRDEWVALPEHWVGEGISTHLGRGTSDSCIVVTELVFGPVPGSELPVPIKALFEGQGTVTAANGDMAKYKIVEGISYLLEGCDAQYTLMWQDGGTGRFTLASGEVMATSMREECGPMERSTLNGTISYGKK